MSPRWIKAAGLLRIFCAMLLLSLSFGHKPAVALAPLDSYDEAYRLPDGTFAEICAEGEHVGTNQGHDFSGVLRLCEACLLAGSIVLPPPDDGSWRVDQRAFVENPLRPVFRHVSAKAVERPRTRAPPPAA